jgi:geranylgeranyl diphosphate synthase type II
MARAAMLAQIPTTEPRAYLYDLVRDYPLRGGRGMRPALHMAAARAFGAGPGDATATAVAVELLHNGLLVLDDIQDESEQRRGAPTLHRLHGIPLACNVGTAMSVMSLVPLLDNVAVCGPEVALAIFEEAIRMAQLCAEGQSQDLGWRRDNRIDVTTREYLDMVLRKTSAYSTIFPLRAGVMVGRRTTEVPAAVTRYAYLLGAAFQVQDDLLNVSGADLGYGKEPFGDLLEGKRTLLTIGLFERASPEERAWLRRYFGTPRTEKTPAQLRYVVELMRAYGVAEHTQRAVQSLVGAALAEADEAFRGLPESLDLELLRYMPIWVIEQS